MDTPESSVDTPALSARRFAGMDRLYGVAGAARLRAAHVVVVGIGGVGSWAAEALARSGVGRLTLIDLDHVAESNINRQIHALDRTLGQAKVLAMRDRIATFAPDCEVNPVDAFVEPALWPQMLPEDADAVIDACDAMHAKTHMAAWALQTPCTFVSVGAAGGKRLAHAVDMADLSATTHDPLLAQLRYRLRKHHGAARGTRPIGLMCVYSKEPVQAADPSCPTSSDGSLNCSGYGSLVSVTASFGFCAAGWVMNEISKKKV